YPEAEGRDRFLYGLGWSYFKLGDMPKSAENFEMLVENYPNSGLAVTAYLQLGEARAQMKNYKRAAKAYEQALSKAKDPADAKTARYDLAWAYYQAKMFKEASDVLDGMLANRKDLDSPDYIEAENLLARCKLYIGDYPPAISIFEKIADKYPSNPLAQDALMGLAEAYERHDEPYKAVDTYKRLLKNYPESSMKAEALFGIGRNFLEQENFPQAVEGFKALLAQITSPDYREKGLFGLAESFYGEKDYPDAKENYSSYLQQFPDGPRRDQALYGLAWSRMGLKEYQASYESFMKLSAQTKDKSLVPEALLDAGEALYDQGKYAGAEKQYKDVLAKFPGTGQASKAVYALAWTELKLNNAKDAASGFEEFSKANPKDPLSKEADYQRALILIQQGDLKAGAALLKSVADRDPSGDVGSRAKLALVKALTAQGDQAQAQAQAQAILDQLKKNGSTDLVQEAVFQQAFLKFNQQDFTEARKLFDEFVKKYPGSGYELKARYFSALSAINLKDYQAAAGGLKKVADSTDPVLKPGALYWYADSCYNLKKYQDAFDAYTSFISAYPADKSLPEAEYGRAWALDKLNRTSDAEAAFKDLAIKYPDGPHAAEAWYKVGGYGIAAKDFTTAASAFENFLKLKQDGSLKADASFQLGEALEALNKNDEAAKAYLDAEAAGGPLKAPSALRAGKLLASAGKYAPACAEFDTAAQDGNFAGEALVGKGKALFAQKKYDEAIAALKNAADHTQTLEVRADGYYTSGECFSAKSDYKDAIIGYTKCVVLGENPYRADSMLKIAESYAALGEKGKAELAYKDFLGAYPDGPKAAQAKEALKKLEG
ncbi:MAG: tetratricopeptide repeat protein, partial [Nitrospirota bacterium]